MRILSVKLNNFRCFSNLSINFEKEGRIPQQVIITGSNGSGKTSILEALYYGCYLRSFKTHLPRELVKIESPGFNISIDISTNYGPESLSLGFFADQKSVKLNQKSISSFKEIFSIYKVIAITEDDLQLVQSSPSFRRNFLDQTLALLDSSYAVTLRKFRQILDNRNALIFRYNGDYESYMLWTSKLIEISLTIQKKRKEILVYFENCINNMLKCSGLFLDDFNFSISYLAAQEELITNFAIEQFPHARRAPDFNNLLDKERIQRRSLLGAHLDDFKIIFENKISRIYSSRGQQKLILFLLKIAQGRYISNHGHDPSNELSLAKTEQSKTTIFLIDDFMLDFDENRINYLLKVLKNFASQIIITSPLFHGSILQDKFFNSEGPSPTSQIINLNL